MTSAILKQAADPTVNLHGFTLGDLAPFKREKSFDPNDAGEYRTFYVGRDDTRFADENRQLNLELTHAGIPHVFRVYAGGHDQSLWQRYAAPWLTLALNHLTPASG